MLGLQSLDGTESEGATRAQIKGALQPTPVQVGGIRNFQDYMHSGDLSLPSLHIKFVTQEEIWWSDVHWPAQVMRRRDQSSVQVG